MANETGAVRELPKGDGDLRITAEAARISPFESGPADYVGQGHCLTGQLGEHRERTGLDLPPQIMDGHRQTLADARLQIPEQRRELPDDVLLGHRNVRDRTQ